MIKNYLNSYRIAVLLSTISMGFGILREFIIVGLLGFTSLNDSLQLYLSVFYTIGLTIDAMRLACLNLYSSFSLSRMLVCASVISLPFSFIIGFAMSFSTGGMNFQLLLITILGGYLNLIATLLITYNQRNNVFLLAQFINVLPNFILIPGVLCCYWFSTQDIIFSLVCLTSLIPVVQCFFLLLIPTQKTELLHHNKISFGAGLMVFVRHFSAMLSEPFYQTLLRTTFYHVGAGYLSMFAITIRIYSAARFILIDSFIGSKLANWKIKLKNETHYFEKFFDLTLLSLVIVIGLLFLSIQSSTRFLYFSLQIMAILAAGFYFSTLVRIVYFKINHHQNNPKIVIRFALFEFACLLLAFLLTKQLNYPILILLWIGYVAKPFGQLLFLRKHEPSYL